MKPCRKCGKKIINDAKSCKYCGAKVINYKKKNNNDKTIEISKRSNKIKEEKEITIKKTKSIDNEKNESSVIEENIISAEPQKEIVTNKKTKTKLVKDEQKIMLLHKTTKKQKEIDKIKEKTKKQIINNELQKEPVIEKEPFFEKLKLKAINFIDYIKEEIIYIKENKELKKEDQNNLQKNNEKETIEIKVVEPNDIEEEPKKKNRKKSKVLKIIRRVLTILILIAVVGSGIFVYCKIMNFGNTIKPGDELRTFKIGDKITYKQIDYKIIKIETSEGNNYKRPKEGNEYLVVTIQMRNKSEQKHKYSYKSWTMLNSLGEETGKVSTTVNIGYGLYSGALVVEGEKTGSLVFEQPIDDKSLILKFYEYNEEEEKIKEEIAKQKEEEILKQREQGIDVEEESEKKQETKTPIFQVKIR